MENTATSATPAYSKVTVELVVDADCVPTVRQRILEATDIIHEECTVYTSDITDQPTARPETADEYDAGESASSSTESTQPH